MPVFHAFFDKKIIEKERIKLEYIGGPCQASSSPACVAMFPPYPEQRTPEEEREYQACKLNPDYVMREVSGN